ncbi:hypothetical protein E2C01_070191 [Portunus trituberculatus]|uniref:Uncharacterized protein n=1 Tax=Portunus trituberculatus TaxID=210409 RepID=A0A5B7I0Y4_PORTR|nr:hypothetical protein [Portunus trituberculatus]
MSRSAVCWREKKQTFNQSARSALTLRTATVSFLFCVVCLCEVQEVREGLHRVSYVLCPSPRLASSSRSGQMFPVFIIDLQPPSVSLVNVVASRVAGWCEAGTGGKEYGLGEVGR